MTLLASLWVCKKDGEIVSLTWFHLIFQSKPLGTQEFPAGCWDSRAPWERTSAAPANTRKFPIPSKELRLVITSTGTQGWKSKSQYLPKQVIYFHAILPVAGFSNCIVLRNALFYLDQKIKRLKMWSWTKAFHCDKNLVGGDDGSFLKDCLPGTTPMGMTQGI